MKFKTKYNIGDIVEFETINTKKRMVGKIDSLVVKCSFEWGTDVVYYISTFEFGTLSHISTIKDVHEYDINNKLNSKAFLKRYAELVAEKIVKGDNDVKD